MDDGKVTSGSAEHDEKYVSFPDAETIIIEQKLGETHQSADDSDSDAVAAESLKGILDLM